MNTTKQAAPWMVPANDPAFVQARTTVAKLQNDQDLPMQAAYGKNIANMAVGGLALGAGGMGLYHLLKALKQPSKKDKKYEPLLSGAPVIAKEEGEKAANMDEIAKAIGSHIPTGAIPGIPGEADPSAVPDLKNIWGTDPFKYRPVWGALGAVGAGALGLYGGGKLVNALMARKKKKDNADDIDEAKKEYYAALTGKTAAALDAVFDIYEEKKATGWLDMLTRTAPQMTHGGMLLALLGSGAIGGKFMYDRTRDRNKGDNLAKAQASRARMKNLPTTWVDPDELAKVKELATAQTHE